MSLIEALHKAPWPIPVREICEAEEAPEQCKVFLGPVKMQDGEQRCLYLHIWSLEGEKTQDTVERALDIVSKEMNSVKANAR